MTSFQQKNVPLDSFSFISCRVPGEFCYALDIVMFCCALWMDSVKIIMKVVLTEFPGWYSSVDVKYGYHGDNLNLTPEH